MKKPTFHQSLRAINSYVVFFLVVAFVVSCCMVLFLTELQKDTGLVLTRENMGVAAKLTFGNVLVITILFATIDRIRRKQTVDRPVNQILTAAKQVTQGDFSVRLDPVTDLGGATGYNEIIDCFNKMTRELSGMETMRNDFIANVSHELKTPLAVMGNYATMLQQPNLSEEDRMEYAKAISRSSRQLAQLITNILKLNKLENQQIYPKSTEFDLGEQLCESLLQYESVWEREEIEIETDIAEGITVAADSELLSLVWNNLLSNAFKFTPKGGTVSLRLTADETQAIVKVSDTGCGMTAEVGRHIFEKFYQGDTSHATHGNGLGLALVKRVVDILHGEISVESTLGVGSTFTVKIRRK